MTRPRFVPPHLRTGSEESAAVRRFWAAVGGIVYTTSDSRAVAATPGIADHLVILPNRKLLVAWESKSGTEQYPPDDARRLTDEQRVFGAYMARGLTTAFGWGDAAAAQRWLASRPLEGRTD